MKIITHFFKKNAPVIFSFCLLLLMLGLSYDLYARAGGGGGGGGGGDDGLIGMLIYILIYLLPFPYNLIAIAILVILVMVGRKKMRQKSYFSKLPIETGTADQNAKGFNAFATANPDFKLDEFKKKVESAFTKVQDAWSKQDLGPVRRFMSDGVYQRFNTQFIMMKMLDQKDIVEGLKVLSVSCSKFYSDGNFDVIDVAIQANIKDKFVSEKYPNLNQSYLEEFVEYWSFIRKKNATKTDMFDTDNCPKCGAALPKNAGDMSKCEYCGTFTNLGDYDWVLSEITQADDYAFGNPKLSKQGGLSEKIRGIFTHDPNFSIQEIEDKVSNGFLQVETARVTKKALHTKRFVTSDFYEQMEAGVKTNNFIYNRIFLNDVTLISAQEVNGKHEIGVAVKWSVQRVTPEGNKMNILDPAVVTRNSVVIIQRDIAAMQSKGSLYAQCCPNCGGNVKDTIDTNCQYCGSELNSTKHEWIISNIVGVSEYQNYIAGVSSSDILAGANISKVDSLYDVRDFAYNNLLIVVAADGTFSNDEQAFCERIAKKWGYKVSDMAPMFEKAKAQSLSIRMPDDMKKREKIYRMMRKAAEVDGISEPEQKLLDYVKDQYLQGAA